MKNGQQDRIDSILSSLDQVQRAKAPMYFHTRLRGRMQERLTAPMHYWWLRLMPLVTMLLLLLLVNSVLIIKWSGKDKEVTSLESNTSEAVNIESPNAAELSQELDFPYAIAAEYRLNDNFSIDEHDQEILAK